MTFYINRVLFYGVLCQYVIFLLELRFKCICKKGNYVVLRFFVSLILKELEKNIGEWAVSARGF